MTRRLDNRDALRALAEQVDGSVELSAQDRAALEAAEPEALSEDFDHPSFAELTALRAAGTERPARTRRPWLIAATLVFTLATLAAAPLAFRWLGRDSSETLGFERAIAVTFDREYSIEARKSAMGRLCSGINVVLREVRERVHRDPALGSAQDVLHFAIRRALDQPELAAPGTAQPGFFALQLRAIREGSIEEARAAILSMTPILEHGVIAAVALSVEHRSFALLWQAVWPRLRRLVD